MIASRHYIPLKHLRADCRLGQLRRYALPVMNLIECPHCFHSVFPSSNGNCPSCMQDVNELPTNSMTVVEIGSETNLPDICCCCGVLSQRKQRFVVNSQKRSSASSGKQGSVQSGLGDLMVSGFFGSVGGWIMDGISSFMMSEPGARGTVKSRIKLTLPVCRECKKTPISTVGDLDLNTLTIRLIVHKEFASKTNM